MSSEQLLLPEHQGLAVEHTAITTSVSLVSSTGWGGGAASSAEAFPDNISRQ